MAPAFATSSPRDHAADDDPSLARKRQRLSEDPGLSPASSLRLELCEPEDIADDMTDVIVIESEVVKYSDVFLHDSIPSPKPQLDRYREELERNFHVEYDTFHWITTSLVAHIQQTVDDSHEWGTHYLGEEADFFVSVARVSIAFLTTDDHFGPAVDIAHIEVQDLFQAFLSALRTLCERIIPLLQDPINKILSRRDSALGPSQPQTLEPLHYIVLARLLFDQDSFPSAIAQFRNQDVYKRFTRSYTFGSVASILQTIRPALANIIHDMSHSMRELRDSWTVLDCALVLFQFSLFHESTDPEDFPAQDVGRVLDVVHKSIKPTVCGKHSRALPEAFHERVVAVGEDLIQTHASSDFKAVPDLYDNFVKSPEDALLSEATETLSFSAALWRVSDRDDKIAADLLSWSWGLQTMKAFICSDIMDVRCVGAKLLSDRLVSIHSANKDEGGFDRPIVQYTIRFLRKTEMTAYIFGPESHAGLIDHSKNVVAFLAVTNSLTLVELDLIWRTSTTSVEADFVQAAIRVLVHISKWLTFDQLLHIVSKYIETPIDKISTHAIEALPGLYKELGRKVADQGKQADRIEIALRSVQLLQRAKLCPQTTSALQLQTMSLNEIGRTFRSDAQVDERKAIYETCTRDIADKNQHATAAFTVMQMLLTVGVDRDEANDILTLAPIDTFMDELRAHVEAREPQLDMSDVLTRLECILRLMSLAEDFSSPATEEVLFHHVYGNAALDENLRNAAWSQLYTLANTNDAGFAAEMWSSFMEDRVPLLPAHLATVQLVSFLGKTLESHLNSVETSDDLTAFFKFPLWRALVGFAISSARIHVVVAAATTVLDLLFTIPAAFRESQPLLVGTLCDFVKDHINELDRLFANAVATPTMENNRMFLHGISLLKDILGKSRLFPDLARQSESIMVDSPMSTSNRISFQVQIRGPQPEPKTVSVTARESTKVSELQASLREVTGAEHNRIIASGIEITEASEKTLATLGIHQIGVPLICPRLVQGDHIDKAFPRAGPVEEEILARYSTLEAFLDGPRQLADKAFEFLRDVRLSHQAREKVVSPTVTLEDLFPADRPCRTKFSFFVLRQHTLDLTRMAAIDAELSQRVIQLLAEFLVAGTHGGDLYLMQEAFGVLEYSLTDRPPQGHLQPCFKDPSAFAARMFSILSHAKGLPGHYLSGDGRTPLRSILATVGYRVLFQAVAVDDALWQAVRGRKEEVYQIHKDFLLDFDDRLSANIATQILSSCTNQELGINSDTERSDHSKAFLDFYWRILVALLDDALIGRVPAHIYFSLISDLFSHICVISSDMDEGGIRAFTADLFLKLFRYQHRESTSLLNVDPTIVGFLQLLQKTVYVLGRTARGPDQGDISATLLPTMLLPPTNTGNLRPLVHEDSRRAAYTLIKEAYSKRDLADLMHSCTNAIQWTPRNAGQKFPGVQDWQRPASCSTGLTNLGMTCYMNSLLQQLFANLQFRKFIFSEPIEEPDKQEVLAALQSLFGRMQDSIDLCADTRRLANALSVQIGLQEDVHTFYTTLLSRLEECMPTHEKRLALTQFFTGKSVTQIRGDCGHVSTRSEPFTELSITVRNKANLHDSLDEFMQGEPLEGANRYKCVTCADGNDDKDGKLVNAMRRTCLEELPDSLTFCLKRFAFDNYSFAENKVNDRFNFPPEIDMSRYKRDHLEDPGSPHDTDFFDLVGVIVHSGSLSYGHYWSYVRVPGQPLSDRPAWMYIEDEKSTPCKEGLSEVQGQCSGGLYWNDGSERPDSGYVLFYQRRSYMMEAQKVGAASGQIYVPAGAPSRVDLPPTLAAEIDTSNRWKLQIAGIFNEDFTKFVYWMMEKYPAALEEIAASPVNAESDELAVVDNRAADLEAKMGDLIAEFAVRILLADPEGSSKLSKFASGFAAVLEAKKSTALHILRHFIKDRYGFDALVASSNSRANAAVFDMVFKCLVCVRDHEPEGYKQILVELLSMHASLLPEFIDGHPQSWGNYLTFVAKWANLGRNETGVILESGYLDWLFDVLYIRWEVPARKRHPFISNLWKSSKLDFSPLFDFLYTILSGHVDLSVNAEEIMDYEKAGGRRMQTENGWCLTNKDLVGLWHTVPDEPNQDSYWVLLSTTNACLSTATGNWGNFPPGKLIGLLASERTNHHLRAGLESQLLAHIDREAEQLHPLLHIALHVCSVRTDIECRAILHAMGRNLPLWNNKNIMALEFFRRAFAMCPVSTLESVPMWAVMKEPAFLLAKGKGTRKLTAQWLNEQLFQPDAAALSGESALDATRIRITRLLLKTCLHVLRTAYGHEDERTRYESMLAVVIDARDYLVQLQAEAKGAELGPAVRAELDESRNARAAIDDLLAEVDGWQGSETEAILPTRSKRTAVELEEVEGEEKDEGDELEMSDDEEGSDILSDDP